MNKKRIIILTAAVLFVLLIILLIVLFNNEKGNISKQEGANVYVKLEKILKDNKFTFEKQEKSALVYDAKRVVQYTLNDGTVIDIYEYEENNETLKQVKKTGKLIVIGSDDTHDIIDIEGENAVLRYMHEGKKATYIKNILY